MSRFPTWFLILTLLMTHGSGCSRMLVRDLDNKPAWKEDVGRHVVVYTIDREYIEGTLEEVGENEITLDRNGVQMIISIDSIKQLAVHGGLDQDQTVFSAITLTLIGALVGFLAWMWSGFAGWS